MAEDPSLSKSQLGTTLSADLELSTPQTEAEVFAQNDSLELVFIDSSVRDNQTIIDNISGATEVVLLDDSQDELVQISDRLKEYQVDGVHLISHGEPGQISFTNTQLNEDTLPEYVHLLEGWGDSLSVEADLLVYGCDVGSGEDGNSSIQQISQITDADVAASVDDTGILGDWELETSIGKIEATSIFSNEIASTYQHNLDEFGNITTTDGNFDFGNTDPNNLEDFTSVSTDNLAIFADAGLDFSNFDASTIDNIDFNEIPSEDFEILQDAGLELEALDADEIAEINLNALSGFDYVPDDIKFSNLSEIDEGTTFAKISDLAVANAELFDYKADLEIEDELSIEQLSEFSKTDFEALDYAARENNNKAIFDSDFYLEEYPSVKEAGVNPYANYEAFGTDGDRIYFYI